MQRPPRKAAALLTAWTPDGHKGRLSHSAMDGIPLTIDL